MRVADRRARPRRAGSVSAVVGVALVALATVWWRPSAAPALTPPSTSAIPPGMRLPQVGPPLPAGARHGLVQRLRQYPALALATARQRAAAERLRRELWRTARPWRDARVAAHAGFEVRRARRAPGERRVMWLHAEKRVWHRDSHLLDPKRPDTLIYADAPGRPLVLVGVMISAARGVSGPTPGGPITRWHSHLVCVTGGKRGLAPRPDGSCPPGARLLQGSEMMHVWFTRDLRSAYAIHAPVPELCAARLLERRACAGDTMRGM